MKGFTAFFKKEVSEFVRTKRLMILLIVFTIIGIMNPATAKLTPKLLDSLSMDGITIGEITVTAFDSWGQFAKNIQTALIVTIIMMSGIYTSEYTKGTVILPS